MFSATFSKQLQDYGYHFQILCGIMGYVLEKKTGKSKESKEMFHVRNAGPYFH